MIYLVLSSLCLALLYGVYRLALSRTTLHRFNRVMLLSIILLSAVLPAVRFDFIQFGTVLSGTFEEESPSMDMVYVSENVQNRTVPDCAFEESAPAQTDITENAQNRTVPDCAPMHGAIWSLIKMNAVSILTYIYIVGMVFFMIRLLIGIIRAETLCRLGGRRLADGSRLLVCDGDFQPTSWRRTVIISRKDHESENSDMIIEHEQAHIRCRHSIDVVLAQTVCALQWFNPAAWALKRSLQEVHEYEADATVLADGYNERQYQICLVQAALGVRIGLVTSNFANCSTKKRITMMRTNQSSPFVCLRALLMVPAVLVTVQLSSACKPDASQDNSLNAPSEQLLVTVAEPVALNATQGTPFDTVAFLNKYQRPQTLYGTDVFVMVEKDGAIWITVDGNRTFYPATLSNFESEFNRLRKESTFKNPNPERVHIVYESRSHLDKCVKLVDILSKSYKADNIHVISDRQTVPPPAPGAPEWGYNVNPDKEKYVHVMVNTDNSLQFTAYNTTPAGGAARKKVDGKVDTDKELKAELERLYPGAGSKVKYSVQYGRNTSIRLWKQMDKLMYDLKYTRAEYNRGPANMSHRDSIDYIILGKAGGDSGRKRHIKNMKWYNENKDKEEFFRMGFINGQLCVCKGNDASKLAPIAFDDLVPYFKANCPGGNERSAIVLLELPMDDESVSVEFLDKLLTKMEGWITTFTRRLYLSPTHIE